jgi:hypothetical protein
MSTINATAPIVFGALQTGYYFRFHVDEIKHISAHERLSDGAKLVWINLAGYAKVNPDLSYFGTQAQIAKLVGKAPNTVQKLLRMLEDESFLMSSVDPVSQIKTYYVQLDADGLNKLKAAPRRGEYGAQGEVVAMRAIDNSIDPRKNIHTPPGKISGGPPEKNPPLININIKNNNKHLNHPSSDISTAAEATEAMIDADALVLRFDEALESIKAKNPGIRQVKANQLAREQFTEQEMACITQYLRDKDEPEKPQAIKTEKPVQTASAPKKPLTENLVAFSIAGGCYLLEESVKTKALSQLQQMYERSSIKGEAANKQLETLIGEVFYYISKAGSLQKEAASQSSKLNTAVCLLRKGNWQTPNGMVKQTIIAREQAWQRQKKVQGQYAPVSTWSRPYA